MPLALPDELAILPGKDESYSDFVQRKLRVTTSTSPGVDGEKGGLRLQFNSRQSSTVDTSIPPFSARHFEYSIGYSTYIPCRKTAIGWPTVDSGASPARAGPRPTTFYSLRAQGWVQGSGFRVQGSGFQDSGTSGLGS
eukprot:2583613-Pyramimonas_sp.AAC.5